MKDSLGLTDSDYRRLKFQQKLGNLLNAKCTKPVYIAKFGRERAQRLCAVQSDRIKWLDTCYDILCEDFSDFLQNYRFTPPQPVTDRKFIWVCWLQGEAHMPEVVKLCIRSLRKNAPEGAQVVVLSGANIREYVDFPDYVYRNLKSGRLTLTHFSDLVRMALLRKYGGLWVDSTVFVSRKIPREYLEMELYSIQPWGRENRNRNIYYSGLTSFLLAGSPECMLFDFYGDILTEKQRKLFDLYYNDDLSLAEISEHVGITRQGVRDGILRAEHTLRATEEKLGLVARYGRNQSDIESLADIAKEIRGINKIRHHDADIAELCDRALTIAQRLSE